MWQSSERKEVLRDLVTVAELLSSQEGVKFLPPSTTYGLMCSRETQTYFLCQS